MGVIHEDSHTIFRCTRCGSMHIERYGPNWDERRLAFHAARAVGWQIEHVGRPRSGFDRVTCPTCAGEDGERELPLMYDPREEIGL
jgi:ribosomal protein S27E